MIYISYLMLVFLPRGLHLVLRVEETSLDPKTWELLITYWPVSDSFHLLRLRLSFLEDQCQTKGPARRHDGRFQRYVPDVLENSCPIFMRQFYRN